MVCGEVVVDIVRTLKPQGLNLHLACHFTPLCQKCICCKQQTIVQCRQTIVQCKQTIVQNEQCIVQNEQCIVQNEQCIVQNEQSIVQIKQSIVQDKQNLCSTFASLCSPSIDICSRCLIDLEPHAIAGHQDGCGSQHKNDTQSTNKVTQSLSQ